MSDVARTLVQLSERVRSGFLFGFRLVHFCIQIALLVVLQHLLLNYWTIVALVSTAVLVRAEGVLGGGDEKGLPGLLHWSVMLVESFLVIKTIKLQVHLACVSSVNHLELAQSLLLRRVHAVERRRG